MTTTTETHIDIIETNDETEQQDVVVESRRSWEGKYVKLDLTARQQDMAAQIKDELKDKEKGSEHDNYYGVMERTSGLKRSVLDEVEEAKADYAIALHAAGTDHIYGRLKENPDTEELNLRAKMGQNTQYRDSYHRFDTRSVSTGRGGERRQQDTYGYHNPSIVTDYKGFNDHRKHAQTLAADLFGE